MTDSFGLDDVQVGHIRVGLAAVKARGLPAKAGVILVETVLDESSARVLASSNRLMAESLTLPHDGVGGDHFSVGWLQQQTGPVFGTTTWGTIPQCMDITHSTNKFLDHFAFLPWRTQDNWRTAQGIQDSAFGDGSNYRRFDAVAQRIVAAYWPSDPVNPVLPVPALEDDVPFVYTDQNHDEWLDLGGKVGKVLSPATKALIDAAPWWPRHNLTVSQIEHLNDVRTALAVK